MNRTLIVLQTRADVSVRSAAGTTTRRWRGLSDAVRYDPQMVEALFSLADGLRRTGQLEAALAHYQTIVAADAGASQGGRLAQASAGDGSGARRGGMRPAW